MNDFPFLLIAGLFLMGLVAFLISYQMFSEEDRFKASEALDDAEVGRTSKRNIGFVIQYSRPIFTRYVLPAVIGMKKKRKLKEKYTRILAKSGFSKDINPEEFFSFKLFLILGFPVIFLVVREFGEFHDWPITLLPVVGILGYFYPEIWIRGVIDKRQKEIILNMPFIVDMLALSVEAGMDFMAAITKVIEKAPKSAFLEEFEILLKEIKIGASRSEALRKLSWRIDIIQIASFTATLIAADSVGANIGPILKSLSAEMRQKRSSQIEKEGAKAATKILFPMLFLIVPAVFIVIAAPIILEMVTR